MQSNKSFQGFQITRKSCCYECTSIDKTVSQYRHFLNLYHILSPILKAKLAVGRHTKLSYTKALSGLVTCNTKCLNAHYGIFRFIFAFCISNSFAASQGRAHEHTCCVVHLFWRTTTYHSTQTHTKYSGLSFQTPPVCVLCIYFDVLPHTIAHKHTQSIVDFRFRLPLCRAHAVAVLVISSSKCKFPTECIQTY